MSEIRLLTESDAEEFWALRLRMLREEPESFGSSYEESVDTPIADVAKRLQASDNQFVLGAFTPELAGSVGCFRRTGIKSRHKAMIWGVYVAAEHRGEGLGRALLMAAIERAAGIAGLEQLVLQVVTTNEAAYRLYCSLGFTAYGLEPHGLKVGDRYLDEHLMMLELSRAS